MRSSKFIILAEDDEDDRLFFTDALAEVDPDAHLVHAGNGKELLQLLADAETLPDIVFLDLNMPLLNGYECLTQIRGRERLKDLFVVVLTTSFSDFNFEKVFSLGASYYGIKPSSMVDLRSFIEGAFNAMEKPRPDRQAFVLNPNVMRRQA